MAQQPGTAPGLVCPIGDPRAGHLRRARRALRDEGDGRGHGAARPASAGPGCRPSSAAARCAPGATASRAWPSSWPAASTSSTHSGHATIAFLASGIEGLKVRVTAKADDRRGGRAGSWPTRSSSSATLLGDVVFSTDDESMETVVLRLLRERGLTLAIAESVTGGLIASRLTNVPGRQRRVPRRRSCPTPARSSTTCSACPGARSCPTRRPWPWPRARAACSVPTSAVVGHRRGRPRRPGGRAGRHRVPRACASTARPSR